MLLCDCFYSLRLLPLVQCIVVTFQMSIHAYTHTHTTHIDYGAEITTEWVIITPVRSRDGFGLRDSSWIRCIRPHSHVPLICYLDNPIKDS